MVGPQTAARVFSSEVRTRLHDRDVSKLDCKSPNFLYGLDLNSVFFFQHCCLALKKGMASFANKNGQSPGLVETFSTEELSERLSNERIRQALPRGEQEAAKKKSKKGLH